MPTRLVMINPFVRSVVACSQAADALTPMTAPKLTGGALVDQPTQRSGACSAKHLGERIAANLVVDQRQRGLWGSAADAEDVVQETWLRWTGIGDADRNEVRYPRGYLVRIVTRQALNRLRTVSRRREEYFGQRPPEQLLTSPDIAEAVGKSAAAVRQIPHPPYADT